MATVKRLLSDIDNKVAAEKPAPQKQPGKKVEINGEEATLMNPNAKPYGKVRPKVKLSNGNVVDTYWDVIKSKEEKPAAINPANVLKEAKPKKEPTNPYFNKEKYGKYFDENYILKPEMAEEYFRTVDFEDFPKENKKINPKKVYEGAASARRKQLLGQMEGIRNEEKENERNLLKDFGNNAIPYDEFKNKQNKLHQDAQGRVDSLYDQLVGGGKTTPNKNDGRSSIKGIKPEALTYEGDDEPDISYLANKYDLDFDHSDTFGYSVKGRHEDLQKFFDDFNLRDYGNEIKTGSDELARREAEAAAPKKLGLSGSWKDEIVTNKNKQSFLNENGFDKDFYWVGNDLVDKKTGRSVYSLPNGGDQTSFILNRMRYGSEGNKRSAEPANINPRQVYENASNAKPRTNSEIIDQSSRDISAELDAKLKNGQISKEEWQEKKANLEAFNRSRNENKDVDYGGLDEEHNRLFEEYMSLDKSYRDISAELDDQVRKGQISTDEWWEKKDKLYDYYTGLKKNKKAEMDSVYAKIKAIDDERERKIQDAKKQKEADALTAKRNQVRADLEKRTGRKYSDDEWATIVELASQLR